MSGRAGFDLPVGPGAFRRRFGHWAVLCLCLLTSFGAQSGDEAQPATHAVYTSLKPDDCADPDATLAAAFDERGLVARECPAPGGWRVFVVSSDERSWLELARGHALWSTEREVVYRNQFGDFPNIGSERLEWQANSIGQSRHLIFRVAAQAPAGAKSVARLSRLFVLYLGGEIPTFCAVARTNQEARDLTRAPENCKSGLAQRPLP